MKSIFKYRPLNELLFKELYYQELYFASYSELNDPLDLSARIEFSCTEADKVRSLVIVLFISSISYFGPESKEDDKQRKKLMNFVTNTKLVNQLCESILGEIKLRNKKGKQVWLEDISNIVDNAINSLSLEIDFDYDKFNVKVHQLTQKFLQNSYVSCFSEKNDDFLMWSHYGSKHTGICLEFHLNEAQQFAFQYLLPEKNDVHTHQMPLAHSRVAGYTIWSDMRSVKYTEEQSSINFFEFYPIFSKETDIDVLTISKSWIKVYAQKLETLFATKTIPWQYEREWRIIDVNFHERKFQEERIRHYPIHALKAIYFGSRTPDEVKRRIYKLYKWKHPNIKLYQCAPVNGKELVFTEWEYFEDLE